MGEFHGFLADLVAADRAPGRRRAHPRHALGRRGRPGWDAAPRALGLRRRECRRLHRADRRRGVPRHGRRLDRSATAGRPRRLPAPPAGRCPGLGSRRGRAWRRPGGSGRHACAVAGHAGPGGADLRGRRRHPAPVGVGGTDRDVGSGRPRSPAAGRCDSSGAPASAPATGSCSCSRWLRSRRRSSGSTTGTGSSTSRATRSRRRRSRRSRSRRWSRAPRSSGRRSCASTVISRRCSTPRRRRTRPIGSSRQRGRRAAWKPSCACRRRENRTRCRSPATTRSPGTRSSSTRRWRTSPPGSSPPSSTGAPAVPTSSPCSRTHPSRGRSPREPRSGPRSSCSPRTRRRSTGRGRVTVYIVDTRVVARHYTFPDAMPDGPAQLRLYPRPVTVPATVAVGVASGDRVEWEVFACTESSVQEAAGADGYAPSGLVVDLVDGAPEALVGQGSCKREPRPRAPRSCGRRRARQRGRREERTALHSARCADRRRPRRPGDAGLQPRGPGRRSRVGRASEPLRSRARRRGLRRTPRHRRLGDTRVRRRRARRSGSPPGATTSRPATASAAARSARSSRARSSRCSAASAGSRKCAAPGRPAEAPTRTTSSTCVDSLPTRARAFDRAVSIEDLVDLSLGFPGVAHAAAWNGQGPAECACGVTRAPPRVPPSRHERAARARGSGDRPARRAISTRVGTCRFRSASAGGP